ncbi:MAG: cytochrome bc complex cytochrome b subunit, partial [Chloroflexi bacterium]|nr:cytochrome bc complex cytochrome b subunit [Chloroflexota bacterium]
FMASYVTLKIIPSELLGIGLQVSALLALLLLPFWDRGPERNPLKRRFFLPAVTMGTLIFIGLTIWGYLS